MAHIKAAFEKDGKRFFVPADQDTKTRFENIINPRWERPSFMYAGRPGGHVSAVRPHLSKQFFANIDFAGFFETITDKKVYRALRRIGLPHSIAFSLAGESTVKLGDKRVLARGFSQSSLLADLVLDQSLIGSTLKKKITSMVTVYCDDIIISSNNYAEIERDLGVILASMIQANFGVNSSKSRGPAKTISVFNFEVSHAELKFTEARMAQFQEKVIDFLSFAKRVKRYRSLDFVSEILNYAQSINRSQAVLLAQLALSERVYQNYLKQLDAESAVDALKSEALRRFDAFIKVAGNGEALRVCHVKFGRGTIVAVDGNKVLVNFDKNGHKLVLKSFLEKLT